MNLHIDPTDLAPLIDQLADAVADRLADRLAVDQRHQADDRLVFTEEESAQKLGIEQHVLREQRRLGHIEFVRGPGRRILYRPEHLEKYLADRTSRMEPEEQ